MDEKEVLSGRITDLWNRTSRGDYLNHTGFLSPDLQSYAREILAKEKIPVKSEGKAGSFFFGGFEEADRIYLLSPPVSLCKRRIIRRFIRRKLGREEGKKETLRDLTALLRWTDQYQQKNLPAIRELLATYPDKVVEISDLSDAEWEMLLQKE